MKLQNLNDKIQDRTIREATSMNVTLEACEAIKKMIEDLGLKDYLQIEYHIDDNTCSLIAAPIECNCKKGDIPLTEDAKEAMRSLINYLERKD